MAQSKKQDIDLPFPVKGIQEVGPHSKQPPQSTHDAKNVMPLDTAEDRLRGGRRPGIANVSHPIVNTGDKKVQLLDDMKVPQSDYGGYPGGVDVYNVDGDGITIGTSSNLSKVAIDPNNDGDTSDSMEAQGLPIAYQGPTHAADKMPIDLYECSYIWPVPDAYGSTDKPMDRTQVTDADFEKGSSTLLAADADDNRRPTTMVPNGAKGALKPNPTSADAGLWHSATVDGREGVIYPRSPYNITEHAPYDEGYFYGGSNQTPQGRGGANTSPSGGLKSSEQPNSITQGFFYDQHTNASAIMTGNHVSTALFPVCSLEDSPWNSLATDDVSFVAECSIRTAPPRRGPWVRDLGEQHNQTYYGMGPLPEVVSDGTGFTQRRRRGDKRERWEANMRLGLKLELVSVHQRYTWGNWSSGDFTVSLNNSGTPYVQYEDDGDNANRVYPPTHGGTSQDWNTGPADIRLGYLNIQPQGRWCEYELYGFVFCVKAEVSTENKTVTIDANSEAASTDSDERLLFVGFRRPLSPHNPQIGGVDETAAPELVMGTIVNTVESATVNGVASPLASGDAVELQNVYKIDYGSTDEEDMPTFGNNEWRDLQVRLHKDKISVVVDGQIPIRWHKSEEVGVDKVPISDLLGEIENASTLSVSRARSGLFYFRTRMAKVEKLELDYSTSDQYSNTTENWFYAANWAVHFPTVQGGGSSLVPVGFVGNTNFNLRTESNTFVHDNDVSGVIGSGAQDLTSGYLIIHFGGRPALGTQWCAKYALKSTNEDSLYWWEGHTPLYPPERNQVNFDLESLKRSEEYMTTLEWGGESLWENPEDATGFEPSGTGIHAHYWGPEDELLSAENAIKHASFGGAWLRDWSAPMFHNPRWRVFEEGGAGDKEKLVIGVAGGQIKVSGNSGESFTFLSGTDEEATQFSGSTRRVGGAIMFNRYYLVDGSKYLLIDTPTRTIKDWAALTDTSADGDGTAIQIPGGGNTTEEPKCSLICSWLGRIVLSGKADEPNNWFMSAVASTDEQGSDDTPAGPNDWTFLSGDEDGLGPIAGNSSNLAELGDPITAMFPYHETNLVFGCTGSIFVLTGDPGPSDTTAEIKTISRDIGIVSPDAWCHGPNRALYFFGQNGLYQMSPNEFNVDQSNRLSAGRLDKTFANLDVSDKHVSLCYDYNQYGVHIFLHSKDQPNVVASTHYYYDERSDSLWPMEYPSEVGPCRAITYNSLDPENRRVLLGGYDGVVRAFSDLRRDDQNGINSTRPIDSHVWIGPIFVDNVNEAKLMRIAAVLDNTSPTATDDRLQYEIYVGDTAEEAKASSPVITDKWTAGRNPWKYTRSRGQSIFVKLKSSAVAMPWAIETISATVAVAGRARNRSD